MTPTHAPLPKTVIFTDGGCVLKEMGLGAFAWLSIRPDGTLTEYSEARTHSTNNRMELRAVASAVAAHPEGPLKIFSDSKYVIQGATEWIHGWRRYGWVNSEGKDVANRDLWERLHALMQGRSIRFEHVRGHNGNRLNERVDALCTAAIDAGRKRLIAGLQLPADERS